MKNIQFIRLLYFSALSFAIPANAQIVYTDLNPDSSYYYSGCPTYPCTVICSVCLNPHAFDLNNDGTNDFEANLNGGGGSSIICIGPTVNWSHDIQLATLNSNAIATQGGSFVRPFNLNDTIGPQSAWVSSGAIFLRSYSFFNCVSSTGGYWTGSGFIGLKLNSGGQVNYGWIRAVADPGSSFSAPLTYILYDYAYNATPNQYILAGDTGNLPSGLEEKITATKMQVSPNPFSDVTTMVIPAEISLQDLQLNIFDLTGRILKNTHITNRVVQITKENFPTGLYLFILQDKNRTLNTGKLVVQ